LIPALTASDVARGTARLLWLHGMTAIAEVPLADGRRADLMALSPAGEIWIIEIKVSAADLRGDHKWQYYRNWCDRFAWAVPPHLAPLLEDDRFAPDGCGLIIADAHEAITSRSAPLAALHPSRRKAVMLAFARLAAHRLMRQQDPNLGPY